ncbi:hypothetical protein [Streptomyces canus]|uniref:hypothetical protein n=1 Tax=Streptomyces canus TaxID=58343 RepID=UPI002E35BCC7|nr:hypothetical protein [Streptomyces canus]
MGELAEQVLNAFGLERGLVVHPAWPVGADPKFGPDPLGREPGEPMQHPKIPTRAVARLPGWWANKKATSIVRDWHRPLPGRPPAR